MKILVVEDEPLYANHIEMLIDELGYELVGICDNSEDFLSLFLTKNADLALIDIHILGKHNGIDVAEKIQNSKHPIPVIFVTSYKDKAIFDKAKKTNPYAYITKPFENIALQQAIELAFINHHQKDNTNQTTNWQKDIISDDNFFVKVEDTIRKIVIDEIISIEVKDKLCQIITTSQNVLARISLKELLEKLPAKNFIQVHRSFIINLNYVENINLKKNSISYSKHTVPISRSYKQDLIDRIQQ
jgi:DNA-binding LytR/AlgR family response regulator